MNLGCQLILGSNSPRRQQLLSDLGYEFETAKLNVDEAYSEDLPPFEVAEYLARRKNEIYRVRFTDEVIITADTTVISNGVILGKPASEEDAVSMITQLSGRKHLVISGFCISDPTRSVGGKDETEVSFSEFSHEEIQFYVSRFMPFDKAGAYGIQEWIGLMGVSKINGSYFNVMGLPTHKVYRILKEEFGVTPY